MDWIILIAALVVSFLVFTLLIRVVKATIGTAIAIAAIVLVLQLVFGIGPGDLWEQIRALWENVRQSLPFGL
ncbi:hypothetical protein IQ268_03495 [Oculatella sp. LEGE 06141]|uniref:hypothetical protein n=1 Tax=Oculatella sp. LEGE 06141 TaxID=1828648 RepID=UPI0018829E92|nr:hypothetical protein [Oculatella sp. LEGE 06141]MBE9177642.1 hypothetical protein [Oculatella sp. LEGE 06141]